LLPNNEIIEWSRFEFKAEARGARDYGLRPETRAAGVGGCQLLEVSDILTG